MWLHVSQTSASSGMLTVTFCLLFCCSTNLEPYTLCYQTPSNVASKLASLPHHNTHHLATLPHGRTSDLILPRDARQSVGALPNFYIHITLTGQVLGVYYGTSLVQHYHLPPSFKTGSEMSEGGLWLGGKCPCNSSGRADGGLDIDRCSSSRRQLHV